MDIFRNEQSLTERLELVIERIKEIPDELANSEGLADSFYLDFFNSKAKYIIYMLSVYQDGNTNYSDKENNYKMYEDIIGDNYLSSYSNPDYAEERLGALGGLFSYIAAELQGLPGYIFDNKIAQMVFLLEMFLQVYFLFISGDKLTISSVRDIIYYYVYDYIDYFALDRMLDTFTSEDSLGYNIIMNEDLSNSNYLYKYGEYISDTEIKLAEYLAKLPEDRIDLLASTYTEGFRRGFDVMGISFEGKNRVWIRYHLGQERIVKRAIEMFKEMGLDTIISRCAINRAVRRQVIKQGYESTSPNMQFEYDHRNDDRFYLDKAFAKKRVEAAEECYKKLREEVTGFAGPAVIETFGEKRFSPVSKESVAPLDEAQQEISRKMYGEMGEISNKYLPGDSYSFTIIAFPLPDIGDNFEEIFDEIININTLDNEKYKKIQQSIIDTLDKADVVRVVGMNGNRTDMTVKMRKLESPEKETQFENCTADVNIPLGEVFTSPVLEGTHGTLNVSSSYLNGYKFDNIEFKFEDGVVTDYNCDNYISQGSEGIEKGKQYIKENILFNHEFLPIGEFAIGTNTYAYSVARKYDILEKLPILIVEKTGPHFALGDTCYSHAEDHAVFNPDGKEIVSRSNSFADLRESEPEKAYFNCHTDITIPYNELGRLFAIYEDGTEVDIIVKGRFVLPGTEELNAMIDDN